ncbi:MULTISPECIES: DUF6179 domain-containing protein [Clostridium]|uniref:DUF6179 domain-containing protein n=1 Tax=Clostridium TaxID=1485 RepID=UPI001E325A29|nr:DUF6179 domain-containing protein [[Clostridium] innocuum]MCC2844029.1 DUF6179 domain-containing protein [[Clostridium] innocuum]MCC2848107.1 DUF6179 domain-containing protein [[Clostridium] innocuum]MCC2852289.1 DUF6179 domain-containing protein [[Clostridium] innocuum]MCQ5276228.1 DUF6179 domain-containing protein [Clostridium sp. DFI.1.208]
MAYTVGKQRPSGSLYVWLQRAQEAGEISERRKDDLLKQCQRLAQELVRLINHNQSTSLSSADHKRILNTISYVVLQGLEQRDALVLQELEIDAGFERGLLVLQEKEQQTRNLLHQLRRNRLPFSNERYSSLLDEQIPHYLEQLNTYEGILYYSHTEEDLDYPLLDGIPLFHDMYHLHGMDLVLYYMERFALEHTFCEYFREELPEFIRRYEQQKGVTVEYLGLNLCELLWYQCFASLTLFQQPSLLLAEQDVERLRALLQHRSIKDAVHRVNQALEASMGTSVADYLTLFEEQLQAQLQAFVDAEHALLVYEEAVDDCFVLELTQGRDEETFLELLEEVEQYSCLQDKIQYLRNREISAYDLISLLENAVFMNEEYDAYYEQLSLEETAVLLKLLHPAGGNFHEEWRLDNAELAEIEQGQEWQYRFIDHIRHRSQEERERLCGLLNKLRIR